MPFASRHSCNHHADGGGRIRQQLRLERKSSPPGNPMDLPGIAHERATRVPAPTTGAPFARASPVDEPQRSVAVRSDRGERCAVVRQGAEGPGAGARIRSNRCSRVCRSIRTSWSIAGWWTSRLRSRLTASTCAELRRRGQDATVYVNGKEVARIRAATPPSVRTLRRRCTQAASRRSSSPCMRRSTAPTSWSASSD
jgi:hypothetical protein